ncbi:DNA polymerase III subunit alpha [Gracilinema caldarium]|uniref:DNA-directed DNA polymerase n=1 Tax=Gracilinema caldarium (strain ATCC 51460 / DSM 7334 / H1) TaxID=744872 RepID=F8F3I2_GRAC1|nr:DNA polymerase III subunit alpha [Gracilinema caldarium]AEJ19558.1 DNA polymerase III, alpha subunit [Gracilinema caldarium DSM 7334]
MNLRLGIQTAYSLLYGTHRPEVMVERAAHYGIETLAIIDRNNLYGLHEFLEACKDRNVRPIIGCELTSSAGSVTAFVMDKRGFSRLCEILTALASYRATGSEVTPDFLGSLLTTDAVRDSQSGNPGLALASADPFWLEHLRGKVPLLYAACGPGNLSAITYARRHKIPLLALQHNCFLESQDYPVHRVLRAIGTNKTLGTLAPEDYIDENQLSHHILMDERAYRSFYRSWPEAHRAAEKLVQQVSCTDPFDGYIFPVYETQNRKHPEDLLRQLVITGAEQRYGELSDAILERIDYELDIINKKGFSSYFLFMHDIVSLANRICGRGSGAASIVSYSLGITNVDPIAHRLYFERFLNLSRLDPPDIDVDFPWDERDALIQQVIAKFGRDYCARVANHNRFRFRSALRETAKVYGYSEIEISTLERQLQKADLQLDELTKTKGTEWTQVVHMAQRLEGLPRGLSMHCGGLVITPEPICHYAPIEVSSGGFPLLTWEKEGTEAAGLVKLDLLGNRSLSVIRDALENLKNDGIFIDFLRTDPTQDQATIETLARGDTLGVFYIESPAMRQLQKKTSRGDFDHIVIHSSIIRPAANRFIEEYVRRLKGGTYQSLHPRLETILAETYGIMCYQEDVSKVAVALASFSESDADTLRKIIAKKAGGKKLAAFKEAFYKGCLQNQVPQTIIDEVWAMMLSFDGYSFNKPHSASYAMVSFQSAYLRVHYPAYFMAAVLSNQGGYYHPLAYVSECRRMGLRVLGPDINMSRYHYYGRGNDVVVGLIAIGGLGKSTTEQLVAEREQRGPFQSLQDVAKRLRIPRDELAAMTRAGLFDSITTLNRALQFRMFLTEQNNKNEQELFTFPQSAPKKTTEKLETRIKEFKTLGFLRSGHPLELWTPHRALKGRERIFASDLSNYIGLRVRLLGWPITRKDVWTLHGETMTFISYEDETALYETVLFPPVYQKYRSLLFDIQPFLLTGLVTQQQGAISLELEHLEKIQPKTTKEGLQSIKESAKKYYC